MLPGRDLAAAVAAVKETPQDAGVTHSVNYPHYIDPGVSLAPYRATQRHPATAAAAVAVADVAATAVDAAAVAAAAAT